MDPMTPDKSLKPGHETDPKPENILWYFIKVKEGEDDGQLVGTVIQMPKSHLEHKVTWLPCDGQLVDKDKYPELVDLLCAQGVDDKWIVGDKLRIWDLNHAG